MSIEDRRNSIRKSSLGIDSIRKSVTSLSEGLRAITANSQELLKQTRETNQLKRKFIKQDGEFFKRRRENALRKQREDELEASTITGVTKRQGSLVQKSTRGFLGRLLDFVGILILGWAITNLPKIIAAFQKLFGFIRRTVGILSGFVEGLKNFFLTLGAGVENFLAIFNRFDFREDDKNIRETFETTQNNLSKLNKDFLEAANQFAKDKDINRAGEVAEKLGIEGGTGVTLDNDEAQKKVSEQIDKAFSEEQVDALNEGGRLDEDNNVLDNEGEIVGAEPRAEGGPVEENKPYIVGEEGPELFVPPSSGEIVSNEVLEETADNIEGEQTLSDEGVTGDADNVEGVEDDNESIISSGGSGGGGAVPSMGGGASGGMDLDADEEEETKSSSGEMITPVSSKDKAFSIKPVKKFFNDLGFGKKKRTTIVQVNNQGGGGGGSSSPTLSPQTKTKLIEIGQTMEKTILDLQSLKLKQ